MKISYKVIMKKVMKNIFQKLIIKILEVQYGLNNDLTFLPERMKVEKVEKLVANLHNRNEYVIHIRNLKQALNHRLILKNIHRVINFNQTADINTKLRQKAKNNFEKNVLKLMNKAVFGKTMENVRKHRNIKLVTTERSRKYLVSEPNYHTTKFFTEYLLEIEMTKTQILINKPISFSFLILHLSKTLLHGFW